MCTLPSLILEYGERVDKALISAIWAEQRQDSAKCRRIIQMLCGYKDASVDSSETMSTGLSEPFSLPSEPASASTASSTAGPASSASGAGSQSRAGPGARVEAIASPEALVEFLSACFPECGADYLSTKVKEIFCDARERGPFQVDPVEAIDIISNTFYNDIEAVEDQQYRRTHRTPGTAAPPTKSTSLAEIEAQYSVPGSKKGKGRRRGKNKNAPLLRRMSDDRDSSGNAWDAIGTELGQISSVFPTLPDSTVRSVYHQCGADVSAAVQRLSEIAESQRPSPKTATPRRRSGKPPASPPLSPARKKQISGTVASLRILFEDLPASLLEQAAQDTHDADAAAERVLVLVEEEEAAAAAEQKRQQTQAAKSKKSSQWKPADGLANYRVVSAARPQTSDECIVVNDHTERVSLSDVSGEAREWIATHPADPERCRQKADAYIQKRNELYSKAAYAYSRRKARNHSGATALFYSTEGHKYDAQARIWRMRAAQASVAAMKRNDANIVDLHGLTRAEAVAVVEDAVDDWYASVQAYEPSAGHPTPLHIVTGLGNHSVGGKACIHPSVVRVLRSGCWKFEEGHGFVNVLGALKS
ncbi:hypothetical protein GGF46_002578 [Coemansia sp. RSA 552]|nr:hypothetical protein GGF46_002578 [Coemansia sp. RSA 552]